MAQKVKKIRLKGDALIKLYKEVAERDEYCCHECGSHENVEIHHIIFKSQGGQDIEENLQVLCKTHHAAKHGIKIV